MPMDALECFGERIEELFAEQRERHEAQAKRATAARSAFGDVIYPTLRNCAERIKAIPGGHFSEARLSEPNEPLWTALGAKFYPPRRTASASLPPLPAVRFELTENGLVRYGHVADVKSRLGNGAAEWSTPITAEWVADQVTYFVRMQLIAHS
jgi:hypothetical protein